jgi:hypothetical protein
LGDLVPGVTAQGGAYALLASLFVAVVGWAMRRVDKGDDAHRAGLEALNARHVAERDRAETRAGAAELALAREMQLRVRVEEYARGLEHDLGMPHRRWSDVDA